MGNAKSFLFALDKKPDFLWIFSANDILESNAFRTFFNKTYRSDQIKVCFSQNALIIMKVETTNGKNFFFLSTIIMLDGSR